MSRESLRASIALLALAAGGAWADPQTFPEFGDAHLQLGRRIWLDTCHACHANDIAGAPLVSDAEAWRPRIAQEREVLYQHALEGFFGPKGTQMPPRGGNDALTDEEVRAAVDYMIAIVSK